MRKWEYDTEDLNGLGLTDEAEKSMLNDRGAEHWEMTGIAAYPNICVLRFYFKRELPPEPTPGCHSLCSPALHVGGCSNQSNEPEESTDGE